MLWREVQEDHAAGVAQVDVDAVIAENPQAAEDFRAGKETALGRLVGQVMKATGGKANPQAVSDALKKRPGL